MIKKCLNQHYYDADRFPTCPFCGATDTTAASPAHNPVLPMLEDEDDPRTVPISFYQQHKPTAPTPATPPPAPPAPTAEPSPSDIPAPSQTPVSNLPYNKLLPPLPFESRPAEVPQPLPAPSSEHRPLVLPETEEEPTLEPARPAVSVPPEFIPSQAVTAPNPSETVFEGEETLPVPPEFIPSQAVTAPNPSETVFEGEKASADGQQNIFGWLVALNGTAYGESFELKGGRNVVTCWPSVKVTAIDNRAEPDGDVFVQYRAAEKACYAVPCGERAVTVGGQTIKDGCPLAAYDVVSIDGTKLLFFPLKENA